MEGRQRQPPGIGIRAPGSAEAPQRLRDDPISGGSERKLLALRVRLQDLQFIVAQHRYDAIDSRVFGWARSRAQRPTRTSAAPTPSGLLLHALLLSYRFLPGGFFSHGHVMHPYTGCCVTRATGTDPFGTGGPPPATIVLDFVTMESLVIRKTRTFHAIQ